MVHSLPTGEISVCDDVNYSYSSGNTGYFYTIDVRYNDKLKTKDKEVSILS